MSLLVICFICGSLYLLIPSCSFIPPPLFPLVTVSLLSMSVIHVHYTVTWASGCYTGHINYRRYHPCFSPWQTEPCGDLSLLSYCSLLPTLPCSVLIGTALLNNHDFPNGQVVFMLPLCTWCSLSLTSSPPCFVPSNVPFSPQPRSNPSTCSSVNLCPHPANHNRLPATDAEGLSHTLFPSKPGIRKLKLEVACPGSQNWKADHKFKRGSAWSWSAFFSFHILVPSAGAVLRHADPSSHHGEIISLQFLCSTGS